MAKKHKPLPDKEIIAKWREFDRAARERYWENGCMVDASLDAPLALAHWIMFRLGVPDE